MNGPTWWINATEYGHGDFLDPNWEMAIEVMAMTFHYSFHFHLFNLTK